MVSFSKVVHAHDLLICIYQLHRETDRVWLVPANPQNNLSSII